TAGLRGEVRDVPGDPAPEFPGNRLTVDEIRRHTLLRVFCAGESCRGSLAGRVAGGWVLLACHVCGQCRPLFSGRRILPRHQVVDERAEHVIRDGVSFRTSSPGDVYTDDLPVEVH